jgi:hypothetical protein
MKFVFERIETQACWHLRMLTSADVPDQGEGKLAQWPGRAPPADLCPALFEHLGMTRMMMTTSLLSRIRPGVTLMEKWKFQRRGFIYSEPHKRTLRQKSGWPQTGQIRLPPVLTMVRAARCESCAQPFLASSQERLICRMPSLDVDFPPPQGTDTDHPHRSAHQLRNTSRPRC